MKWGEVLVHGGLLVVFSWLAIWLFRFLRVLRDAGSPVRVALRSASPWQDRLVMFVFPVLMFLALVQVLASGFTIVRLVLRGLAS